MCRKGYPDQRKTFETKSDAQAWARMIESEIDTSKKLPKPKPRRVKYRPPRRGSGRFPMEFYREVI
ncbi:Arm DNA-binding domain-containing protein [Pseudomonas syringae]|uniref:Arm DNA-binding domain-containing protein n=1 Tax=Pseudomonas syringae TaxID=317 RepID=UPI00352FA534